jgi:Cu-Zn family superoxide dismutase
VSVNKGLIAVVGLSAALTASSALAQAPAGGTAEIVDASGKRLGAARVALTAEGARISGRVEGLTPGEHGFHIHAVGQCLGPAFASAGGHMNPMGRKHGFRSPEGPHLGDMENLVAGADGAAAFELLAKGAGAAALFDGDGSALVIHAGADDHATDPAGNSGARVACGVLSQVAVAPTQLPRAGEPGVLAALAALASGVGLAAAGRVLRRKGA